MLQAIRNGIHQKRLIFLKTKLPFILSLNYNKKKGGLTNFTKDRHKYKEGQIKTNFENFMLEKCNVFFRAYRSYRALALKRVLRKSAYAYYFPAHSRK